MLLQQHMYLPSREALSGQRWGDDTSWFHPRETMLALFCPPWSREIFDIPQNRVSVRYKNPFLAHINASQSIMLVPHFSKPHKNFLHWCEDGEMWQRQESDSPVLYVWPLWRTTVSAWADPFFQSRQMKECTALNLLWLSKTGLQNLHCYLAKQFPLPGRDPLFPAYFYCWHFWVDDRQSLFTRSWKLCLRHSGQVKWQKGLVGPQGQNNSLFQELRCPVYTLLKEQWLHNSSSIILGQSRELRWRPESWFNETSTSR